LGKNCAICKLNFKIIINKISPLAFRLRPEEAGSVFSCKEKRCTVPPPALI